MRFFYRQSDKSAIETADTVTRSHGNKSAK